MKTSRRGFLSLAAGAAVWGWGGGRLFAAQGERPPLRIGAVSDIHISFKGKKENCFQYGAHGTFRAALEYFRDMKVDAVTVTGDLADSGRLSELEAAGQIWREVFPDDKLPDGSHVEPIFIYGNHDYFGHVKNATLVRQDLAGSWKKAFGRDWSPVYHVKVKGYTFIGMHWGHEKDLPAYIKAHEAELDLKAPRPFFCLQHPIPKDTLFAHSGKWGEDKGQVTKCLSAYPNAVSFSGHTHMATTDVREVWQGAFTAINCCTLAQIKPPSGCVNTPWRKDREKPGKVHHMAGTSRRGKQGYLMDIWPDRLEIECREFVLGMEAAPRFTVPIPAAGAASTFAYAQQAKRAVAPEFPAGVSLVVSERDGKDSNRKPERQIVLEFPSATSAGHKGRVERYRVEALPEGGGEPVFTCQVAQDFYFHPIEKIPPTQQCIVAAADLPAGQKVKWRVTPLGVFGQAGKPLAT